VAQRARRHAPHVEATAFPLIRAGDIVPRRRRHLLGVCAVKVRLWGTRGSVAAPGADTARYGGNTSCVEVRGAETAAVLDAGTGNPRAREDARGHASRPRPADAPAHGSHPGPRVFAPLLDPDVETHLWGPAVSTCDLRSRLARYLSPPLFPVHLRDLPRLTLHDVPAGEFAVGEFRITADRVCHPGFTVGYRITGGRGAVTYLPDHEPALGATRFPSSGPRGRPARRSRATSTCSCTMGSTTLRSTLIMSGGGTARSRTHWHSRSSPTRDTW